MLIIFDVSGSIDALRELHACAESYKRFKSCLIGCERLREGAASPVGIANVTINPKSFGHSAYLVAELIVGYILDKHPRWEGVLNNWLVVCHDCLLFLLCLSHTAYTPRALRMYVQ